MSFWKELKRRNIYKVGVAYVIIAWLLIQFAAIAFPHLNFPSWTVIFVIVVLIIGFPLILLFAWAFEITPEGLKLTKEVPHHKSITHITGKKLNYILAGLLVLAVAYILFNNYYFGRSAIETPQVPVVSEVTKTQKTIAVIPFVNLSSDPEQEYFVDGLSEELLNSLSQIPDLLVTARTSSFTFKRSDKTVQEIANILGVENILEGSVRKAGNALRITAQLVRATDGFHLFSKTYDRELKDIFAVQEDIATAVTNELKVTLALGTSLKQLGGTDNEKAYELYLMALGQSNVNDSALINRSLESIDAAIALDPKFALAWAWKAGTHSLLSRFGSKSHITEQNAALSAALKAIELEPNLADGYAVLGGIRASMGEFLEAGSAYQQASELSPGSLYFSNLEFLKTVGYFKKAHELVEKGRRSDPLNETYQEDLIESFGYLRDMQKAEDSYELAKAIYGDDCFRCNLHITNARLGSGQAVSRDDILISSPINDAAKEHLESPKEGLEELHQFYTEAENLDAGSLTSIAFWSAYFGDNEFAMDAIEKAVSLDAGGIKNYWCPLMKQVRQLPRFKELVKKIGIVEYWNKFGWPDFCYQLSNGDFVCD